MLKFEFKDIQTDFQSLLQDKDSDPDTDSIFNDLKLL
jgi:hypothetical protein